MVAARQSPALALDFQLHTRQLEFVTATEHFLALVGGIGSGKTISGVVRSILASFGQIGDQRGRVPNSGMITAPTYPMLRDATLHTFFEYAGYPKRPGSLVADFNKSEMQATMINGSRILFRSADNPDRLRGPNLSYWFGDEAAMYSPAVWRVMIGRLREHGVFGYAWLSTTPRGRNWLWKQFVQTATKRHRIIKAKTRDNPFAAVDFVESLEAEYSGDFAAQELDGEFVAHEGLIYPEFDRDRHKLVGSVDLPHAKRIVAGVDWGFTNPGVITVGAAGGDGQVSVLAEEYRRQRRIEEWVDVAVQMRDTWGIERFYCDPSEPTYIDKFNQAGLKAEPANNDVNAGIQEVRRLLVVRRDDKPRLFVSSACGNLISEFEQYQWAEGRDGLTDKPLKANDHAMDALRYMLIALANFKPKKKLSSKAASWTGAA